MAFQTVLVQAFAREFVTFRQHLSADALIEMNAVIALHHRGTKRLARAICSGGAHGNTRHALNAAADSNVITAGNHALRGKMNGLLAGAALAINGSAGNRFREAGGEHRVASDVSCLLADLHYAAGNHVVDARGIKLVARDEAFEREAQEIDRMPGFQHAVAPAERRADCINDDCFSFHSVAFAPNRLCSLKTLNFSARSRWLGAWSASPPQNIEFHYFCFNLSLCFHSWWFMLRRSLSGQSRRNPCLLPPDA